MVKSDLESIAFRFAHGECGAFAAACEVLFSGESGEKGSSLVVFHSDECDFVHAAIALSDDRFFDAYGTCSFAQIECRYALHSGLRVEPTTREALVRAYWFDEEDVKEAMDHAALLMDILKEHGWDSSEPILNPQDDDLDCFENQGPGIV